jgi:outer membrane protein assembly factor BamB
MRFCALSLVILFCSLVHTQEWTRFRGPNGTGQVEVSLPAEFQKAQIRFQVELPGIGHSSPVLWDSKLFVLSADAKTATRYLICLHADTGEKEWVREFASQPHKLHVRSSYASSTPAVDEQHVYAAWSTPEQTILIAHDHRGTELWRRELGRLTSQHGFGMSPITYENLVILVNSQDGKNLEAGQVAGESFLLAFDRSTGAEVWRTPMESTLVCYSVPCLYKSPDGGPDQLLCLSTSDGIYSLNPKTGGRNWQVDAFTLRTVSSPVLIGDLVLGTAGSGGGGHHLTAVRIGSEPTVAYKLDKQVPYVPTAVARDDLLFLWHEGGVVSCLDAATGEMHWSKRVSGEYNGSPIRAGDKLYCVSVEGELVSLAATKEFQLLGRTQLSEGTRATLAVHRGRLYVRTFSKMICLDPSL